MKRRATKFISIMLAMVLIAVCCTVAGLSASAAAGDVVYFDNSVTKFDSVYCYMWEGGSNGGWPGQPMTNVTGDIWAYNVPDGSSKVIFNGSGGQSADLDYPGTSGMIARPTSGSDRFTVNWEPYDGTETLPTQATQATQPTQGGETQPTNPPANAGTIYCQNDANWSSVYVYMWNSENDKNAGWPGEAMTDLGDGVYEYNYSKSFANVIFSENGQNQTSDINNWATKGNFFNNKTGAWENYSSSPVKITSFTTSLESPSYTNTSIKLSATAKSSEGALTYKFMCDSTVLSSGDSSSVLWVPTAAGTYKLTVEVSDTAGNKNTRSMNFEVKSDQGLEGAYIRGLSNSLGTIGQLKKGTAVTFTTDAIGGHTGNGLLFYKFVVTDPDGAGNTAYYTTGSSYSYTPAKLGTYKITAYVQNSYNATVSKTYTYTSVNSINEQEETTPTSPSVNPPTQATNPTQATQATQPTSATNATTASGGLLGDANNDGKVNINDVTTIQMYLLGLQPDINLINADWTGDGDVKIQDANYIQRKLLYR